MQVISLRSIVEVDRQEFFEVLDQSRQELNQQLSWVDEIQNRQDLDRYLEYIIAKEVLTDNCRSYLIYQGPKLVGMIDLHDIDWQKGKADLGYWLASSAWGQGIMTRAVGILEKLNKEKLNLHEIHALIREDNQRSQAVVERCGYRFYQKIPSSRGRGFNEYLKEV